MWRIISKEARELAASPRSFAMLLLAPCVVLWLAVRLPEQRGVTRVYVGENACAVDVSGNGLEIRPCETPTAGQVRQALSDAPDVRIVDVQEPDRDVWRLLNRNRLDAAFIWSPVAPGADETVAGYQRGGVWTVYMDPRKRADAARLDFAVRLLASNDLANARLRAPNEESQQIETPAPPPPAEEAGEALGDPGAIDAYANDLPETAAETPAASTAPAPDFRLPAVGPLLLGLSTTANNFGATPVVVTMRNGPTPSDSSWLSPGLIALISTFIAFLTGASSLARESEQGTLHWLSNATRSSWLSVVAGKAVVATLMGSLTLLVLVLFNWLGLGQPVNEGFGRVFGLQVLSLLVASMQGVAISAFVGRQDQAILISGAYLILLALFSGVFLPIAGAGGAAEFISWLLPATFSQASLVDWMQHASSAPLDMSSLNSLGLLLAGSTLVCIASVQALAVRQ